MFTHLANKADPDFYILSQNADGMMFLLIYSSDYFLSSITETSAEDNLI